MAEVYSRNMMKVALAKMLQTIGWNSIHSTPLEILTDIMTQYVVQIARTTHDYANEFGCVEPSLDHLGLAFRDFHINLSELEEYITYVNFAPPPTPVPKYPVAKKDNLNFLKPGSKEVITRQVHVHEHLPPMFQVSEATESENEVPIKSEELLEAVSVESTAPVFKRPADVSPGDSFKRPRLTEEEGRPTREISSVMMTTSGYISPAREGKLPESRTPAPAIEPIVPKASTPPQSSSTPSITTTTATIPPPPVAQNNPPASSFENPAPPKSKPSNPKKTDKPEKKKSNKELFKNVALPEDGKKPEKVKKQTNKEPKPRKNQAQSGATKSHTTGNQKSPNTTPKVNKTLAAARLKTEKLNTTITPIPNKIGKLATEPDKKKVNILKKISNVRNDKEGKPPPKGLDVLKSAENSPALVIDEPPENKLSISNDVTIELVNAAPNVEKAEKFYFDDDSPPGTPSTPKTPEMITHQSPPVVKEKRKRKDKSKIKKLLKPISCSPIDMGSFMDMERPKTPEAHVPSIFPPPPPMQPPHFPQFPSFPQFLGGPGLIPPQLVNPLLPINSMFGLNSAMSPFIPRPNFPPMIPPLPPLPKQEVAESKRKVPADSTSIDVLESTPTPKSPRVEVTKKKKDKKDKIKKKNKKDKLKSKGEKKKLKEEKKDKIKKEKKEKRKDKERENVNLKLTFKIGGEVSPRADTPEKKLNIKPIIKREEEPTAVEVKREMSPELAKISALVTGQPKPKLSPIVQPKEDVKEEKVQPTPTLRTHPGPGRPRIHPIKQKPLKTSKRLVPVKDSDGNEVWICPACGRQDDGSPMIGCDDCDAWYHWVCVGIQVPPDETENWYCRQCIVKKQEVLHTDKKKKRKKKEKKEH